MSQKEKIETVEKFIFNDEVQNILSEINNNVMDFNILEITGMGTQEIKHSNILGWMFDDSEHNLEYQILDGFLKKVIQHKDNDCDKLQSYLYLSDKKRDIKIYREKDKIDLLIVDETNKVVITIENKLYASESETQLEDYKKKIKKNYNGYEPHFIFLTIGLEEPSEGNEEWLLASHQWITDTVEDVLKTKEMTIKTKIILESYVDLLKRNGIVADKSLEKLCNKIWANKEYRDALNIIIDNKSSNIEKISHIITDKLESFYFYADNFNDIIFQSTSISDELYTEHQIYYNIEFGHAGIFLRIFIDLENEIFDNLYKKLFPSKKKRNYKNLLLKIRKIEWDDYVFDISIESLKDEIAPDLELIFNEIKRCDKILKKEL